MNLTRRISGANGLRVVIGSAFLWAWLDACFMSKFFVLQSAKGLMSEVAVMAIFAFSIPMLALALVKSEGFERILASDRLILGLTACGTVGGLIDVIGGFNGSYPLVLVGGLLGGVSMAVLLLGWGAPYCKMGAKRATPYVSGAFACAIIIDVPVLFMFPLASAIAYTLFPLISGVFLIAVPAQERTYGPAVGMEVPKVHGVRSKLNTLLGISVTLLVALIFIMVGFGYMQHMTSFSVLVRDQSASGLIIQITRGVAALTLFVGIVLLSWRARTVYRVGLLVMIAGFMTMPFLFRTDHFWLSGAIVMVGYTSFDILIWVASAQIAHTQSKNPIKTVALVRTMVSASYVVGAALGILVVGTAGATQNDLISEETTVVGYLVVIATVLLLSNEDIWTLLRGSQPRPILLQDEADGTFERRLDALGEGLGFTSRECEVALLLLKGRTQPWISGCLGISENTVGTHVRHIYQKAEAHNRQEFFDIVLSKMSTTD